MATRAIRTIAGTLLFDTESKQAIGRAPAVPSDVGQFVGSGQVAVAPTRQLAQEQASMFYQGFVAGPTPTVGTPATLSLGGLLGSTINTLTGALAERLSGQVGSNDLPAAQQAQADALKASGMGFVPASALQSTAVTTTGSNGCGCQPRPSRCEPQYIERDFGGFGLGNPCSADPRYPRPSVYQGQPVCAPARRRPRMNPLNPRAAGRAARRLAAAGRAMKRIKKSVQKAERSLR